MAIEEVTNSEIELIKLLGFPNKVIGEKLNLSEAAVSMKLTRVCVKMGVENRTALVIKAVGFGLMTIEEFGYRRFDGEAALSGTANTRNS